MKRTIFGVVAVLLAGCTERPTLPPPGPDFCETYLPFVIARAAARLMESSALQRHAGNEVFYHDKCGRNRKVSP